MTKQCRITVLILLLSILLNVASTNAQENERIIIISSTNDAGEGSLREALQNARSGDHIIFDPQIFPPNNPTSIFPKSELPPLDTGGVTIDGSGAGVIIDGSLLAQRETTGFLDDISLITDTGENLIANGDFAENLNHWLIWQLEDVDNYGWNSAEGAESEGAVAFTPNPYSGTIMLAYQEEDREFDFYGLGNESSGESNRISVGNAQHLTLNFQHKQLDLAVMIEFLLEDGAGNYEQFAEEYNHSDFWSQELFEVDVPAGAKNIDLTFSLNAEYLNALVIRSDNNAVQGIQIINFSGDAILIEEASRNKVGGARESIIAPCIAPCNLLSGNVGSAVAIYGGGENIIQGNFMGTDSSGLTAQSNGINGVRIYSSNNIIGGEGGEGNLISTNSINIEINGDFSGNHILGNLVGVDITGEGPLENPHQGIALDSGAHDNSIENNVISSNEVGIMLGQGCYQNKIIGNAIGTDISHTLELGNGTGLFVMNGAYDNEIGPSNYIINNKGSILVSGSDTLGNRITRNTIYNNIEENIINSTSLNTWIRPPSEIAAFSRMVSGYTEPNSKVEMYTYDKPQSGGYYVNEATSNADGYFDILLPDGKLDEYVSLLAYDEDGTTSTFSQPVKVKKSATRALPGIIRPEDVSKDAKVIGVNVFLAIVTLVYVGIVSTYINEAFEVYSDLLEDKFFTPIKKFFTRISPWGKKRVVFPKIPALTLLLTWLFILTLIAVIQSFLDTSVLFSSEQRALIGTLFLGGVVISSLQTIGELVVRSTFKVKTEFKQAEVGWPGVILAAISSGLSYSLHLNPGIVLGSVDTFFLKPDIEDENIDAIRAFVVKLVILGLTFIGWLFSAKFPNAMPLLEMFFLVGLQYAFFELIPLDVLDGEVLHKKYPKLWGGLFIPTTFGMYHLLFNPSSSDVQGIMQGNVGRLLWIMSAITVGTILFRWGISKLMPENAFRVTKAGKNTIIILLVTVVFGLLAQAGVFNVTKLDKAEETTVPISTSASSSVTKTAVPILNNEEDAAALVQIEFNGRADLSYFNLMSSFDEDGNEFEVDPNDVKMEQGAFYFGDYPLRGATLKQLLEYGTFLHLRWQITDEETCYAFPLWGSNETEQFHGVSLGTCSYGELSVGYPDMFGDEILNESAGSLINVPNQWVEAVFWVENRDSPYFYALAWDAENPASYYLTKSILPDWANARQFAFSLEGYEGEVVVDFLKIINGDIESYLELNAPPFAENVDQIHDFLHSDISTSNFSENEDEISHPESIEVPTESGDFTALDLAFDEVEDIELLETSFGSGGSAQFSGEDFLQNGALRLSSETGLQDIAISGISMGNIVHVKTRVSPNGPCFFISLKMNVAASLPDEKILRLEACPDNPYHFVAVHNMEAESEFNEMELAGKVDASSDAWSDALLSTSADGKTIFVLTHQDGKFSSITVDIDPDWQAEQAQFIIGIWSEEENQFLDVDFIRVVDDSLDLYLAEQFPLYAAESARAAELEAAEPQSMEFSILHSLDFTDTADLSALTTLMSSHLSAANILPEGALRLGGETAVQGIFSQASVPAGSFSHVRLRVSSDTACFFTGLKLDGAREVHIEGCPDGSYSIVGNDANSWGMSPLSGSAYGFPVEWADMILWSHPDGDKLFFFISNAGEISYSSVQLLADWQTEGRIFVQSNFESESQYLDVDFIRIIEGSLKGYMNENIPAYLANQANVDTFLRNSPQTYPLGEKVE